MAKNFSCSASSNGKKISTNCSLNNEYCSFWKEFTKCNKNGFKKYYNWSPVLLSCNTEFHVFTLIRQKDITNCRRWGSNWPSSLAECLFTILSSFYYTTNIKIESNERKWFHTKKKAHRQNPVETIMAADYADDLVLLTNTPAQAKSVIYPSTGNKRHWFLHQLR